MFIHGREALRRNSILVLYNFYKNLLYIMPQYVFGFYTTFSGQPLYEPFIYQLYNITFTSIPIVFFCLFDFEYLKTSEYEVGDKPKVTEDSRPPLYFMEHPLLFKYGMEGHYFGVRKFIAYLFYSVFHSIIVFYGCFYYVETSDKNLADGKTYGIWIGGHLVYGACIIIANISLMLRFNNYTRWGEAFVYLMILAYFTIFLFQSFLSGFPELYNLFVPTFSFGLVWIQIILVPALCLLFHAGAIHINHIYYQMPYVEDVLKENEDQK